jgi:Ca2+-binding RTX toxin-like protein
LEKVLTIGVTNVNETPTNFVLSNSSVGENQAIGTVIGNLNTTDPDSGDTFTYSLVTGTGSTDNALFAIAGNQLKTNSVFDYETKKNYSIRMKTTDQGGLSVEKVLTIGITNINETPTNLVLSNSSVGENQAIGTVIGNLSTTDPDSGNTFAYSLVTGTGSTDNALFTITGNQLKANAVFDYETKNSYSIRVQTQDQSGLSYQKQLTIGINDVIENTTITGTANNENFTTTNNKDIIDAGAGNDTVTSVFANLQQSDTIKGNTGIDTLFITRGTSESNLSINAGNTNNQIPSILGTAISGFERFNLDGFIGKVSFLGTVGNDWIQAGVGNDYLDGGAGNDYLNGGTGNDIYVVDSTGDVVIETSALATEVDHVYSSISYTLGANLENLTLLGTNPINGTGNNLNNNIRGNGANNTLNGGDGNDGFFSLEGDDIINAGNGDDQVFGGTGNDTLNGEAGNDVLYGEDSNDTLNGGDGNDYIVGGAGNDYIVGGAGAKDNLVGGLGSDKFVYQNLTNSLLSNFDVITDFNATTGNDLFRVSSARAGFVDVGVINTLDATGIGTKLTAAAFGSNFAAKLSFGQRTFVAINDATAGFNAATDGIIEVTGLTGTLNIANFTTV